MTRVSNYSLLNQRQSDRLHNRTAQLMTTTIHYTQIMQSQFVFDD